MYNLPFCDNTYRFCVIQLKTMVKSYNILFPFSFKNEKQIVCMMNIRNLSSQNQGIRLRISGPWTFPYALVMSFTQHQPNWEVRRVRIIWNMNNKKKLFFFWSMKVWTQSPELAVSLLPLEPHPSPLCLTTSSKQWDHPSWIGTSTAWATINLSSHKSIISHISW
jgi:hypothetical protein